jgi:hypothetical protein
MGVQHAAFTPALQRLIADAQSCFGLPVERIEPDRVIERAFSGVLRARAITKGGEFVVYCKVFRSPVGDPTSVDRLRFRVEREFRETARACNAFAGKPGFSPLEPVAVYPDLLTLVTKEVKGEPLHALSRMTRRWSRGGVDEAIHAASLVGEWLRIYQLTADEPQDLAIHDLRECDTRLQPVGA